MPQNQAISEMPLWILILIAMAGLSGEMLRVSGSNLTTAQIVRHIILRFSASGLIGMATLMLVLAWRHDIYLAGGLGILAAVLGADATSALYTQWVAKRAGVKPPTPPVQPE